MVNILENDDDIVVWMQLYVSDLEEIKTDSKFRVGVTMSQATTFVFSTH